jgi:hypothetical protein
MHTATPNTIHSSNGIAFNGTDHFTTFSPDITTEQRALAHQVLERALNDEELPEGWHCVRGTRRGRVVASTKTSTSETNCSGTGSQTSLPTNMISQQTGPNPTYQMDSTIPYPVTLPDPDWQEVQHSWSATAPDVQTAPAKGNFNIFNKGLWGRSMQAPKQKLKKTPQKKTTAVAIVLLQPTPTMVVPRTRP